MIFVTGGAGFIGANFILDWIATENEPVVNIDKLTYAGNLNNLSAIENDQRHIFVHADINDKHAIEGLFKQYQPRAILNFAAESHVDRSILGPEEFINTNINGTFTLLEVARQYWVNLTEPQKSTFRFLHISTDEVYGSLRLEEPSFSEVTPYAPNSPYAASKAASDHLVRAYYHTYGLPTLTTNCSNNYGPYQFPEKLIPLVILHALQNKPLPIYGDGLNIRDWLYVTDHCDAIRTVLANGKVGETYNIGSGNEKTNIDVVTTICTILDEMHPSSKHSSYAQLITYVRERPGHDRRYAINARKIQQELKWQPKVSFETGIRKTIEWYLQNQAWVANIQSGEYQHWMIKNYQR